jgi:hypothetical protein
MEEELYNLIKKLRDESSFVQSEKKHLIELFKQVLFNMFYLKKFKKFHF